MSEEAFRAQALCGVAQRRMGRGSLIVTLVLGCREQGGLRWRKGSCWVRRTCSHPVLGQENLCSHPGSVEGGRLEPCPLDTSSPSSPVTWFLGCCSPEWSWGGAGIGELGALLIWAPCSLPLQGGWGTEARQAFSPDWQWDLFVQSSAHSFINLFI